LFPEQPNKKNMKKRNLKIINAVVAGAIVASVFITISTILSEIYSPFKSWLTELLSHHWISKSVISTGLFFALSFVIYFIPEKLDEDKIKQRMWLLFWLTFVGVVAISVYYAYHFWLA